MAREVSILFSLKAALTGGFTGAFQSAASSARGVASAIREMEKSPTGKLGASMASQRQKIRGLSGSLRDARSTLATLQTQAQAAGGASVLLARQIRQAEDRVNNLSGALKRQLGTWRETVAEAATAGGSVRRLSQNYEELSRSMERAKRTASALHANKARGEALGNQRADLQGRLLGTVATSASVALPVKLAISAEDTFADLRKVMDAPEEVMQQVFADAQEMSNRTGKSFEDVIRIMTAGAQAGLGKTREELLGVADQAVKMSIAWGVSAEEAGKSLANWQSSMGLTSEQAKHTANVINALSNTMNAEAGEINSIFTRMGEMMKESGMATQDIAALATAFKAAGAECEVSGTAMKNFINAMAAGSGGLTDARKKIYRFLEIDPDQLQKELYNDSKTAILKVLNALKSVRPEERMSLAGQLFGQESIAAISPLIGHLDLLTQAFDIANGKVDGSVEDEYANRMKTTATSISQMTQSVRNLGVTMGTALLPVVGEISKGILVFVNKVSGLVKRFPNLSSAVMIAGASIAALAVGSLALGLVINTMRTGINSVTGLFLRMSAAQIAATGSTGGLSIAGWLFTAASNAAGAAARFFAGGLRSILMASGVGALLVALGYGVYMLIENWDAVVAVMSSALEWIKDTWSRLGVFFTELGKNLVAAFPGVWDSICVLAANAKERVVAIWDGAVSFFGYIGDSIMGVFSWALDSVLAVWTGAVEFFSGIGLAISDTMAIPWQYVSNLATWAFETVSLAWTGAVDFFGGIVDGIWGKFTRFFSWLQEKFAWVFSAIDAVSSVISKVTGAVAGAWNKAFGESGDKGATPAAKAAAEKPVTATAGANPKEKPVAPAAQASKTKPVAPLPQKGSFSEWSRQQDMAEKNRKGSGGGGGGGAGRRGGTSGAGASGGSGNGAPVTIVTLAGDNSKPQTLFIPASSRSGQSGANGNAPIMGTSPSGAAQMPATRAATAAASIPRALPQTPGLIAQTPAGRRKDRDSPASITVDLKQQFDLITSDAAAARKILDSIKPDMEALVRRALEKMQSDRRRTAYAQ